MKTKLRRMLALIIAMLMILFGIQFGFAETPDNSLPNGSPIANAEKDTEKGYITIVSNPVRIFDRGLAKTADDSDLSNFLDKIEITGAEQDAYGNYVIIPDVPYTIQMFFSEKINGRQFGISEQNNVLTYHFPGGFSTQDTWGSFTIPGDEGYVTVDYVISGNTLTVTFDPESPGYQAFLITENMQFEIHATGIISEQEIVFSTEVTGEFVFDDSREVSVQKAGSYDGDLNRIKFTVQASSKGHNTDVHIGDIISGTMLTYDPDTLTVSSNKSNPVVYNADTRAGETFGLTLLSMAHGETVTIEYYADVDLTGVTGIGNGNYGTLEQTGNSVKISSHDDWPGHEVTIDAGDYVNKIKLSNVRKTASSQFIHDGKTYVTWTIVLNENANLSLAGKTVTDTIDASSQQIMRYSGNGLHIEKYEKDGTPAGSGDIAWGTGGLTASNGGSTWTYTIPASDAGHNYKYVITYETEVDSDMFLTTTTVNNSVRDEYDTAYGGANIGTTGQEVDADKSVVHTNVDAANKTAETEWMITFNVPPAGLDSAVINDTLPSILDPETNTWFYDALKADSVRVKEGDLREGESFSVDTTSQNHHVIITFTKNNGESGLSGTGLMRTIHVYLTTTASRDWLLFAERESRARTHLNYAVVTLNGQDIHVSEPVVYNTLNLEKVVYNTYSSNTDPALPIYVYQIILSGVNDDTFVGGPITITDTYDADYLTFQPSYDTNQTYYVNGANGYIYGNNQWNKYEMQNKGPYVVDQSVPEEGKIIFKIDSTTIPKLNGAYYPYYAIYYALQIKDAETLEQMKAEALHTPGLKVPLNNTASSDYFGTNTITTDYTIHALEKTNEPEVYNTETGTYDIQFKLEVNEEALKIGDKDTITVKDTITNLSFDYTSITISPQLEGDVLNRTGNSILFTLHNETHYTITYTTRLVGLQDVAWNNKAELFGYITEKSGNSYMESGGSGSFDVYRMNVMKYAQGNMNEGLEAEFELFEARVKDADGNDISSPTWMKVHEFTTNGTTGIYQIRTVSRDGVEASLRPYSYHDNDGNECFGTGENYGWRYRLVEIKPPPGFIKTDTVYEFGISDIPSYTDPYKYLNDDTVTVVNTPIDDLIEIEIFGNKALEGRKLIDQEFAFSLKPEQTIRGLWGDDYPGGFSGSLTARNDENGHFSFPLSFTYEDYLTAVQKGFIDESQRAEFYYILKEELPEGAEGYVWKGVTYDRSQFLVLVKLYVDDYGLKTEISGYPYDENGIADALWPSGIQH